MDAESNENSTVRKSRVPSKRQLRLIEASRQRLAEQISEDAEREANALRLAGAWQTKRPSNKRSVFRPYQLKA